MGNKHLIKARTEKNDEFYTQLHDIEKELQHYEQHFKGKVVYSNCDTKGSSFVKYFEGDKERLGIKKFVYSSNDFRSEESIELLKESNIVVTNPPFSLFREYIAQLIEYNKKFLIVGNNNAITYKELFPYIKENKIWLGIHNNKTMEFTIPDYYEVYSKTAEGVDVNGNRTLKVQSISWFTNLTHSKRNEELLLYKYYNEEEYPKYDNYDAINVDKVKDIPQDYMGIMGVPITFLDKYNHKQFEIVGTIGAGGEFNVGKATLNGKDKYKRLLIKRREPNELHS